MIWLAVLSDAMFVKPTMSQKKMVVSLKTLSLIINRKKIIQPAREARGPEGPAR